MNYNFKQLIIHNQLFETGMIQLICTAEDTSHTNYKKGTHTAT